MSERRRGIRMPVDGYVAYRAVGMQEFELCRVREISTRSMLIVLVRRLPDNAIVTVAVQQADSGPPVRLYTHVLRAFRYGDTWKHVLVAASRQLWPATLLVDVACATAGSRQVRALQEWLES